MGVGDLPMSKAFCRRDQGRAKTCRSCGRCGMAELGESLAVGKEHKMRCLEVGRQSLCLIPLSSFLRRERGRKRLITAMGRFMSVSAIRRLWTKCRIFVGKVSLSAAQLRPFGSGLSADTTLFFLQILTIKIVPLDRCAFAATVRAVCTSSSSLRKDSPCCADWLKLTAHQERFNAVLRASLCKFNLTALKCVSEFEFGAGGRAQHKEASVMSGCSNVVTIQKNCFN